MTPDPTPWRAWLRVAADLSIPPREFWRLSMREWRALTAPAAAVMSRASFDRLAELFPDKAQT